MRLQRDSYAPKSCAFDAANVQFLRAHLCKSHPVLQHTNTSVDDKYRKSISAAIPNFRISAPVRSQLTLNRKVKLYPVLWSVRN